MRYGWLVAACLLAGAGCREADGPLGGDGRGVLVVQSEPAGGAIWLDGKSTGQLTPDTLRGVGGLHELSVVLDTMQLRYRYTAQVVVQGSEPITINGPLMARCTASTSDCASPFRSEYQLGPVRFATNAIGALFLEAGQGAGLYWPGNSENSYLSTATPVFAARWAGQPVSTGIYDTDFLAGRPAPRVSSSAGTFTLSQRTWILPSAAALQFTVARGIEIRERLLTTTSQEAVFLVRLTFQNITNDPIYGIVDPAVVQLGGITFEDAYIGIALDPDIGTAGDDWVSYDGALATVFAYDAAFAEPEFTINRASPALVGLRVLQRPAGTEPVLNAWTRETASDWEAGTTTQAAGYGMLSGITSYNPDHPGTTIGHLPGVPGDVRMVASVGPLRLAPGDSASVVFAVALALPAPGTYASGTVIPPGNPDEANRQILTVAGLLRDKLIAAEGLLGVLGQ